MNTRRQLGFGIIPVIVILSAVVVLGFVGWRVFMAQSNKPAGTQQTSSSTSTQQQTDPNAGYVVIHEWGVRFKPASGLTNVIYASGPTAQAINFSTSSLKVLDPNCDPDKTPAIGGVERATIPYNDPQGPHPQSLGVIGGYYYYYDSPQSACSDTKSVQDTEAQQITLLKQSVISLEAAK